MHKKDCEVIINVFFSFNNKAQCMQLHWKYITVCLQQKKNTGNMVPMYLAINLKQFCSLCVNSKFVNFTAFSAINFTDFVFQILQQTCKFYDISCCPFYSSIYSITVICFSIIIRYILYFYPTPVFFCIFIPHCKRYKETVIEDK